MQQENLKLIQLLTEIIKLRNILLEAVARCTKRYIDYKDKKNLSEHEKQVMNTFKTLGMEFSEKLKKLDEAIKKIRKALNGELNPKNAIEEIRRIIPEDLVYIHQKILELGDVYG